MKRPVVSIVGPGRFGSALAINLKQAGWDVARIGVRANAGRLSEARKLARKVAAEVVRVGETSLPQGLVWITVPDSAIGAVAAQLAGQQSWTGMTVFHSSGALTSGELEPLRKKGARVASVHPGMTFVRKAIPKLQGVPFGIEGDAAALRVARRVIADVGGISVTIRKEHKVLYHAFDAFASPLLIALMATLEEVGKAAGIPERKLRSMAGLLLRQTLENYLQHGAAAAFSGPFVRGDVEIVRRHLEELRKVPLARDAYAALARVAVKHLPGKDPKGMRGVLKRK
jgi:predicted short-subunit dehydrogenase-like oxidoreductase (DUF2520 family)